MHLHMAQPTRFGNAPSLIWKIPSRLSYSLISAESKFYYGANKRSCSNLCNKRKSQFSIHKVWPAAQRQLAVCLQGASNWILTSFFTFNWSISTVLLHIGSFLAFVKRSIGHYPCSSSTCTRTHTLAFSCQHRVNYCCCKVWVGVCIYVHFIPWVHTKNPETLQRSNPLCSSYIWSHCRYCRNFGAFCIWIYDYKYSLASQM